MQVILLAGGRGTRFAEETDLRPKPMIEVGSHPILWHIMKTYSHYGFNDFIVACGYKSEFIKDYFYNFNVRNHDWEIDLKNDQKRQLSKAPVDFKVTVVDTGLDTLTGGRIKRLSKYVTGQLFMVTYGDGVSNVAIDKLVAFHKAHGKIATVTGVHPPARFGELILKGDSVERFSEKPQTHDAWINGGFFVFDQRLFNYLDGDETVLERTPLERLAADGELKAFLHAGFWQPMDTLRDKIYLESLWNSNEAPWKVWK